MIVPQQGDTSPKALELKQFDAYLKRELPRKIRKELEAAMERIMGPMEETLQRQLEDIVRDCHENLTRSYCSVAQPTDAIPGEIAGPSRATEKSEFASLPMLDEPALDTHSTTLQADALSQYNVPPESSPQLWPDMMQPPDNFLTEATWSDSVYFSQFESLGYPIWMGHGHHRQQRNHLSRTTGILIRVETIVQWLTLYLLTHMINHPLQHILAKGRKGQLTSVGHRAYPVARE
jgi:hypothetical protein